MRKLLPIFGVLGLAAVVLVAVSGGSNLVLGSSARANVHPYGDRVSIDGGQVNISVAGEGEQTVVLLGGHGTASPVLDFPPLIDELDDTYTVVLIDRFDMATAIWMSHSEPSRTSPPSSMTRSRSWV